VPTWRATKDIEGPHDIVEEVARIYGYANITPQLPSIAVRRPHIDYLKDIIEQSRDIMAYGFDAAEVYTYSFRGEKDLQGFGENPDDFVKVHNPITEDAGYVRREILPNLIREVVGNQYNFDSFNLFEVGKVFKKEQEGEVATPDGKHKLPLQDTHIAGLVHAKGNTEPYYLAKNMIEILLHRLHFDPEFAVFEFQVPWINGQRVMMISVAGEPIGIVGELDEAVAKKLKIKERVGFFEINLNPLARRYSDSRKYTPLPKFPSIEMDVSMIVDAKTQWQSVQEVVDALNKDLVQNSVLFDMYEGEGIPAGKKSVAFRIEYRSEDRTLETKEVELLHNEIKESLTQKLNAQIR
jgi:phenylalanyl-tRNA synthetase beta chain